MYVPHNSKKEISAKATYNNYLWSTIMGMFGSNQLKFS